jgi:excisionase family DNA binding protein
MTALPDVLTVTEVAQLLDCSPDTVEDETRQRSLPGLKFGRSWVYPRAALLLVLEERALAHVATPAPAPAPASAPKVVPMAPRPPQRQQRGRGRSPAPLPDPPALP